MRGPYHVYAKDEKLKTGYGGYSLSNGRPGWNPIYSLPCALFPEARTTNSGLILRSKFRPSPKARGRLSEAMNNEIPIPDRWLWGHFRPDKTNLSWQRRFGRIIRLWKSGLQNREERPQEIGLESANEQPSWLTVERMRNALEGKDPMLLSWIFAHTKRSTSGMAYSHPTRRNRGLGGAARSEYPSDPKRSASHLKKLKAFSEMVTNTAKEAAESILNAQKTANAQSNKPQESAVRFAKKILAFFRYRRYRQRAVALPHAAPRNDRAPVQQIDQQDPMGSIKEILEGSRSRARSGDNGAKTTTRVGSPARPRQRRLASSPIGTNEARNTRLRTDGAGSKDQDILGGA